MDTYSDFVSLLGFITSSLAWWWSFNKSKHVAINDTNLLFYVHRCEQELTVNLGNNYMISYILYVLHIYLTHIIFLYIFSLVVYDQQHTS